MILRSQVHSGVGCPELPTPALFCLRVGAASGTVTVSGLYSLHRQ